VKIERFESFNETSENLGVGKYQNWVKLGKSDQFSNFIRLFLRFYCLYVAKLKVSIWYIINCSTLIVGVSMQKRFVLTFGYHHNCILKSCQSEKGRQKSHGARFS
jgi:hypothetical protein